MRIPPLSLSVMIGLGMFSGLLEETKAFRDPSRSRLVRNADTSEAELKSMFVGVK